MYSKRIVACLLLSSLLASPVYAQTAAPAPASPKTTMKHSGEWRASKVIGVNVYNQQNEKIGDINEVLIDPAGKVAGVVIGAGGFLGMGEHDVLVKIDQIKFVNEPLRTSAMNAPTANTTGTGAPANRPARSADEKWYPDHAVMNVTKDQLKAMPEFKYSNFN